MKKFKKILLIIMTIGFLFAGFQLTLRFLAEQRNKLVEIVADYKDFSEIALELNMPVKEMADKLVSSGVTSIAISEERLLDMRDEGKLLLYSGVDLNYLNVHFNNEYLSLATNAKTYLDNNLIPYSNVTLVFGNNEDTYNFLVDSFKNRFRDITVDFKEENDFCILINRSIDKVKNVGLGLTDEDFEEVIKLGFNNAIPRVENHEGITPEEVDSLYSQVKKYKVKTIIFAGVTVFGQDYQDEKEEILKYIGEKFSQTNAEIITAIIEKPAETDLETIQRGIKSLSKYSKYVNTKVFSADTAQLQKLSYENLVEQWGRAISQRNVRVIYVRPLAKSEKTVSENLENTLKAIKEIKNRIKYMGMELGNAKGLGSVKQNRYFQLFMGFGIISSAFFLLLIIFEEDKLKKFLKAIYCLYGIILLGLMFVYLIPLAYNLLGDLANKVLALISTISFASIGGVWLIEYSERTRELKDKSNIKEGILLLIVSVLVAVIGGVFVGAILSDSKYILKLDTFRGVKISFLVPLLVWGLAYVVKVGLFKDSNNKPLPLLEQCKKLFETQVTVKYVAIAGVILLALAIIVMRSGNTMISSASNLELMFRNLLEKYLVARPRTKELIAFPILLLIPCLTKFKSREWSFLAMGAGMIGIENVINSFCHIRMPVFVTTLSTIFSLIFAIIIGSICVVIIDKIKEKF